MLTADLVRVRKQKGELRIVKLEDKVRARALELAEVLVQIARDHVGKSREELEEALSQVECAAKERLLLAGLQKLIEDRCEFDVSEGLSPEALRAEVFLRAAALCRSDEGAISFDRAAVLTEVANLHGVGPAEVERSLYADLRSAHLLVSIAPLSAKALIDGYDLAQAQAVLLRAVRVIAEIECDSAGAYRALFHKLKFLRLLYRITPIGTHQEEGYRLEIDGPFSLFESVTKYGLQLALSLPTITACDRYRLRAEVRWGKDRQPLDFLMEGASPPPPRTAMLARNASNDPSDPIDPIAPNAAMLPDEVAALLKGFASMDTPWRAQVSPAILHLPGVGVCVPDLVFEHSVTKKKVFLEVMGYWSRDAVWRRVELVEQGLRTPILFAVSQRLRVSEQVLGDDLPAALYVYKGTLNARLVADRLDRLSGRL